MFFSKIKTIQEKEMERDLRVQIATLEEEIAISKSLIRNLKAEMERLKEENAEEQFTLLESNEQLNQLKKYTRRLRVIIVKFMRKEKSLMGRDILEQLRFTW